MHFSWLRLSACAVLGAALAAVAPASGPAYSHEILNYTGPDRQQRLEEGARKEGRLVIYSSLTVNQALRPLADAFSAKYPYIRTEYWRGDTSSIAQKVLAEIRARAPEGDVLESSGLSAIMVQANALLPFTTPLMDKVPQEFHDKNNLLVPSRFSYMGTAYNTRLVPVGEQPKTLQDLLDPKWKGRLSWRARSESGDQLFVSMVLKTLGDTEGEAYLRQLSTQGIVNFTGSARALVNRVIEGEYPVALNIFLHHPLISAAEGAPVAAHMLEPVPSISGSLMIPQGVQRPHAAMLFVDFYLSDEGQNVLREAMYFPVMPHIRPDESIAAVSPRINNVREAYFDPDELFSYRDRANAIIAKYFR